MAILTIDGWEIPVESVTRGVEYLDTYKRAFSGNLRDGTRFAKRKWDVTTAYLNQDDARTLRALIHNEGDRLSANHILGSTKWDNDSKNFLVSNKGNVIGSSNVATYRPLEGPDNTHAFAIEANRDNLFKNDPAVNPSLEGTLSGGTLSGFTVSNVGYNTATDTDSFYHGTKSLKVYYKSGNDAWRIYWSNYLTKTITDLGLAVGDAVTFSWYEKHNIDLSTISGIGWIPAISFYDTNKNEIAAARVELTSLGPVNLNWHRHSITATIPADTVYIGLQVGWDAPNFTSSSHFYNIDALQLEKMPFATSFTMDTRTFVTGYMPFIINYDPNEISFFIKTKVNSVLNSNSTFVYYGSGAGPITSFINNDMQLQIGYMYERETAISNLFPVGDWDNICFTFSYAASKARWYSKGAMVKEVTSNQRLRPSDNLLCFYLPNNSMNISSLISEVYILPIAVSDSFAKAYTSSWLVPNNNLLVSGDCANGQVVPCYAELGDTETASYWQGGTVYLAEKVNFTLYEI